jgi:hypothetical protein
MPTDEIVTETAKKALEIHFGTKGVIAITTLATYGAVSAGRDALRGVKQIRERKQRLDALKAQQTPQP